MNLKKAPKQVKDNIKKMTANEIDSLCKEKLSFSISDIKFQFQNPSNIIYVIYDKKFKLKAFAIAKVTNDSLELSYLCSSIRGGGSKLLNLIEKEALLRRKPEVYLFAVDKEAIEFYKKKGYKSIDNQFPNDMFKVIFKGKGNISKVSGLI